MLTSLATGTRNLLMQILVLPSLVVVGLYFMQAVQSVQSQVALSTTEAEYIAMFMALRDVIPIMNLLDELRAKDFQVVCTNLTSIAKSLKTIQVLWSMHAFPIYVQGPSISMYAIIIFVNMYTKVSSRSFPLILKLK